MALEVARHQGLDGRAILRVEVAAGFEVVGQAPGLFERPGLKGRHELDLVDDAILKREQAEKEMAVSGDHGETPIHGRRSGRAPRSSRTNPGIEPRRWHYRMPERHLYARR